MNLYRSQNVWFNDAFCIVYMDFRKSMNISRKLIIGKVTFNFRSFTKRYTTSISDKTEYRLYS